MGPALVHLCHCEEPTGDVAIRISPAPEGADDLGTLFEGAVGVSRLGE